MAQLAIPVVNAPFTKEQIKSFNEYQKQTSFHPFTCTSNSNHRPLRAQKSYITCPDCGSSQTWAHEWMMDDTWKNLPKKGTWVL